jgi:hypothetical protein
MKEIKFVEQKMLTPERCPDVAISAQVKRPLNCILGIVSHTF